VILYQQRPNHGANQRTGVATHDIAVMRVSGIKDSPFLLLTGEMPLGAGSGDCN
jgi:hypothetical protein